MRLGYNTNGFAHHRLEHAISILADIGYRSVALTLDHHALSPYEPECPQQLERVRRLLMANDMRCVIETGARFLLDPRRKHQPTLISPTESERHRRQDFLQRAVEIAAVLHAECVSIWSGTAVDDVEPETLFARLVDGCSKLLDFAEPRGVKLAFEPEPGMFIDTLAGFETLRARLDHPLFGLTIDVGHLQVNEDLPPEQHIPRFADCLFNVHLDDARRGVHEHLFFGEGEIDFAPMMQALGACPHDPGLHVELSRHSHDAVATATAAFQFVSGFDSAADDAAR